MASAVGTSAKRQRSKKGGLGQLIGVVLGGLLALPITFAILTWGFRKDPLNIVRHVPDSVAFLFPQELVNGVRRPAADGVAGGPTLDDVPAVAVGDGGSDVTEERAAEPVPEPAPESESVAVADAAASDSAIDPVMAAATAADVVADAVMADPAVATPVAEPTDVAAIGLADIPLPATDPFGDLPTVTPEPPGPLAPATAAVAEPPPTPEPEPLDLSAVESAVAAAREAFEAVEAFDADAHADPTRQTRKRNRLLVEWYRQVSLVAEELSALERLAADTGRPLDGPPDTVRHLQEAIVGDPMRLDELARLSRDWMTYKGRSTSGILMPAVLAGVRHVGPYWCSTVTVADAGDRSRDLVVISRAEPTAAPGDAVLVTGLIIDGDTLWASDVRPAVAGVDSTLDPFAAPVP